MSAGSPKVVLHVVDSLGLSGKTRHLVTLASSLDRRRFSPIVCSFDDSPGPLRRQLEAAGVPVRAIACRDGLNAAAPLRLGRLARALRADIVHCYNPRPMLYGGLAARAVGIRATIGFLSAFACHVPDRAYSFLPQPLATSSRRNVYRNRVASAAMRFIVAVSPSLGRRFCEHNGVTPAKLRVIGYGADVQAVDRVTAQEASYERRRLGFEVEHLVIGSVGRLVEQKDYVTQLRAFALAAAQVPRLRMVIAGDGPLRAALQREARTLAIADRVRFVGHRDSVAPLLRAVDLFVLASRFEPFGVVLLEAQAAGLPIVATAVNEIPEIVADRRSGLLTPPEDATAMADRIVTLAKDAALRARLGLHARLEAERHDARATAAAYEALYEASLEPRPRLTSHGRWAAARAD